MAAKKEDIAFRFLVDGEDQVVTLTYQQLDERARAIGAKLASMGMHGQRALLLFPPGLDFIEAFFGCHYAGVVPVPAYPPRRNRNMGRINAISEDCHAAVALSITEVIERVGDLVDDAPSLKRIPWIATEAVPVELATDWVEPAVTPDDIGLLQYTSGSTGSPKGVVLTHRNLITNCRYIKNAFPVDAQSIGASWLPLYHDMGLVGGVLLPLCFARESILMSPVHFLTKPVRWLRAISKYRATISGGPSFAYALCNQKISPADCAGLDLSCWRTAFNGAEPLRADVLEQFTRKFAPYGFRATSHHPCYGMAEATLIVTGGNDEMEPIIRSFDKNELTEHRVRPVPPDSENARRLVGCGRVIDEEEVIIVHPENRREMPNECIGEIWIRSGSVGRGYWNKPEETRAVFQATLADDPNRHWMRSGDLGFLDDGELFITGRLKDMIIVRGVNRYPQDIEATAEKSSERLRAAGAAAFSVEHWDRERLIVVAEVERGKDKQWGDVLAAIRTNITAEHDLPPDAIILIRSGSIPKTSSGKIQRHACRQAYLDDRLLVVAQWIGWEDDGQDTELLSVAEADGRTPTAVNQRIVDVVIEHVRHIARERAKHVQLDTNIVVDLGLDSLERLQIANSLEETFGGRFPDDVLQEIETIREVAQAIEQHLGSEPLAHPPATAEPPPRGELALGEPIPEAYYNFDKMPEYIRLQRLYELLESTGVRNPFFSVHDGTIADTTRVDGRELVSFSSYNYVAMSGDPEVQAAAKAAIDRFGTSVSASRLVSGEKTIHRELEDELAQFLGVEEVITFPGGHATNESVIGHLLGRGDLIIHDALAHNSIIQGAELSGARRRPFDHNDWRQLDQILGDLRHEYRRVLVAIEGLYSMDGDYPELPRFVELRKRHKVWLFVDEAHSIGTLGATGRGLGELFGVDRADVDLWMGTLSKSMGSCGGFIGGSQHLIRYLRYTTPGFVFAAGIPPANVGAALASLRKLQREPERIGRLASNAALFLRLAKEAGLNTGLSHNSPIIPVVLGNSLHALRLSEALFHRGINVQPILHPAVEENQARLRFFVTSRHTEEQIRAAVAATAEELAALRPDQVSTRPRQLSIAGQK
jgi:8-amino-7-oxononanoate synthase/acyl carrier protein